MAAKSSISSGILFTDRRDFYIQPAVVNELFQDITPFTTLMGSLGSVSVEDPVFKQFEYRNAWLDQYVVTPSSGALDTSGAIDSTVSLVCAKATPGLGRNSAGVSEWNERELASPSFDSSAVGLLLQYSSGDNILNLKVTGVSSSASTTLLCVILAKVGTVATIPVNARVDVIGSVFDEGGVAPDASSDDISVIWGRTQIMKTSIEVTGTLYHMALRGYSDELARLRSEKMKEHKIQKEKTFLLGIDPKRSVYSEALVAASDAGTRYTAGVIPSILKFGTAYNTSTSNSAGRKANVFSVTNATSPGANDVKTFDQFIGMTENLFATIPSSSESRVLFCGAGLISHFSNPGLALYTDSSFQLTEPVKGQYGFNVRKLVTPHGEINLVHAPVLRGNWRNYGVMVDTDYVKQYTFRPTTYQANIKTDNAYDGVKDQIMSDEGIGLSMLEKHAVIKVV